MMLPNQPLILIIDGNNLAYALYTNLAPRQKLTTEDDQRLLKHLSSYARTYPGLVEIELCFDHLPETILIPGNIRAFRPQLPNTGDELLLERFSYHHLAGRICLVVTNDEERLDEVREAGGAALTGYQFIRRAGKARPVFMEPAALRGLLKPAPSPVEIPAAAVRLRTAKRPARKKPISPPPVRESADLWAVPIEKPEMAAPLKPLAVAPAVQAPAALAPTILPTQPAVPEPAYRLDVTRWPADEAARVLVSAFCKTHAQTHRDLLKLYQSEDLQPADLQELAALLLQSCGAEPDFARRGALIRRVALALLRADGKSLSLAELAEQTGLNLHGLRGRIKAKAGRGVEILER